MVKKLLDGVLFTAAWEAQKHPRDAHGHFLNVLNYGDAMAKNLLFPVTAHLHEKDDVNRLVAADYLTDVGRDREASLLRDHEQHPAMILGGSVLRLHGDLDEDGSIHVSQTETGHKMTLRHGGRISTLEVDRHRGKPASAILAKIFAEQQQADHRPVMQLNPKEVEALGRAIKRSGKLLARDENLDTTRPFPMPNARYDENGHVTEYGGRYESYYRPDISSERLRRGQSGLHFGYHLTNETRAMLHRHDFLARLGSPGMTAPNRRVRERVRRSEELRLGIPLRDDGMPVYGMDITDGWRPGHMSIYNELRDYGYPYFAPYGRPDAYDENVRRGWGGYGFKDRETLQRWVDIAKERNIGFRARGLEAEDTVHEHS